MYQTPGPSVLSVIGQLPRIINNRLEWMIETQKKYGDIVRLPFGPRTHYAVFHPDYFRHILVANAKNYCKGRTFEKTAAYLGQGIATIEGAPWQIQRRRMNPHLNREALAGIADSMVQNIQQLLLRWEKIARQGETLDLADEFQRLALETVARALFGVEVPETEISQIISAFKISLKHTSRRTMNPFDIPESLPIPSNIRFARAIAYLDATVYRMIREEAAREEPSHTLLAMLLNATDPETGERMTEKQLRDEVMTLFLGGTDTSGNTLSWVFYNLATQPTIKAQALEEISTLLNGRLPQFEDVPNLSYLKRLVEETLRLYPQNWAMSRDTIAEDTIGGCTIPAGSTVFLGTYVAHRRPDFWENSEQFDPNRFLPENSKGRHTLSYIPFGAGPRKCIGYQFALMEFAFAISMILQKFDFELETHRVTPYPSWSLWPKPGLKAKLHLR